MKTADRQENQAIGLTLALSLAGFILSVSVAISERFSKRNLFGMMAFVSKMIL